ncbi:hypothetical protein ACF1AY_04985 [Streptomyces sp. NPDC014776]|uniref:hypothetical protein n=1 Tax=Streptomyces sp. NPDC014776 TaxID=3364909 RepID=UPI0036F6AD89
MSPMWDGEPQRTEGVCVACGAYTTDAVVRWVSRVSGPDVRLIVHAKADDCVPAAPVQPLRLARLRPTR